MAKKAKRKPIRTWQRWLQALGACYKPRSRTLVAAYAKATSGDREWLLGHCNVACTEGPIEKCPRCNPGKKMPAAVTKTFREWARASQR